MYNRWPECILNWHRAILGQGDLILFKRSLTPRKVPKKGNFKSSEPVDQRQKYSAWNILMTCRSKIVQLLSLGSHMTPP